jgi:hypothetical protein
VGDRVKLAAAILAAVGVALVAAGVALGVLAVHRDGIRCGSGFTGVSHAALAEDFNRALQADLGGSAESNVSQVQDDCAAAVSDRKSMAWVALAPGIALVGVSLVLVVVSAARNPNEPSMM